MLVAKQSLARTSKSLELNLRQSENQAGGAAGPATGIVGPLSEQRQLYVVQVVAPATIVLVSPRTCRLVWRLFSGKLSARR
jgi:hypothetical protein